MIILDKMLIGGIRFVLDKVAQAVDNELNNDERIREELLAAQMKLELGELTQADFDVVERDLLARLREINERKRAAAAGAAAGAAASTGGAIPSDARVSGVEISFGGDDDSDERR